MLCSVSVSIHVKGGATVPDEIRLFGVETTYDRGCARRQLNMGVGVCGVTNGWRLIGCVEQLQGNDWMWRRM